MAKIAMKEKEARRTQAANRDFGKRAELKAKIKDCKDFTAQQALIAQLNKLPRDGSKSRGRNRCMITGRPHGFLRKVGISRIMFRQMASRGEIPGVKKASW